MVNHISIIIPNYNGKEHLENCLKSLQKLQITDFELQITIVDNGSDDNSVKFIRRNFQKVKVIELGKNYGFAKAINEGIRASKADYIALLNNDTKVDKGWLTALVKAAQDHPEVSIFASNILSWDGKKNDSQGIEFFWKGKAGQINQGKEFKPLARSHQLSLVFGASAAAALYRQEIFEKFGFFDEDFFAYLEDVDFTFRTQLAGERCLFVPGAMVYHLGGATRRKMGNFKARMDAKNWIFLIVKNYPTKFLLKYFFQIFIERLRNLNGLIKQTPPSQLPKSIFQTYGEVLIKLPKMIAKRDEIQRSRKVGDDYFEKILTL